MSAQQVQKLQTYRILDCYKCGGPIAMSEEMIASRKRDRKSFYCVAGHPQRFAGKNEADKLREELALERKRKEWAQQEAQAQRDARGAAERQVRAQKAAKTRLKNRIAHGVCPCCQRTFQNLARHMTTRHPSWSSAEDDPA